MLLNIILAELIVKCICKEIQTLNKEEIYQLKELTVSNAFY